MELWLLILGTDFGGLAIGVWLFWGSRARREAGVGRDLYRFVVLGAGLGAVSAIATQGLLHSGFAVIRIWCHVLFCVLAPLLLCRGMHRLAAGRATPFGALLVFVALGMEGTYLWARHFEPYRLEVNEHVIQSELLEGIEAPIRVAVLADLQTDRIGDYEREVFRRLDALRADLILVPGDLLHMPFDDAYERERRALIELFRGLRHRPRLGIFFVEGDIDELGRGLPEAGVQTLDDEAVRLGGKSRLQLLGLSARRSREPLTIENLRPAHSFDGLTIVVGHSPDFVASFLESGISSPVVCVAGHTHGGQVVVPGYGAPMTLSALPRQFASGLHRIGEAVLCVSRGVGMERGYSPRIRLFCRPELVLLELRAPARP